MVRKRVGPPLVPPPRWRQSSGYAGAAPAEGGIKTARQQPRNVGLFPPPKVDQISGMPRWRSPLADSSDPGDCLALIPMLHTGSLLPLPPPSSPPPPAAAAAAAAVGGKKGGMNGGGKWRALLDQIFNHRSAGWPGCEDEAGRRD